MISWGVRVRFFRELFRQVRRIEILRRDSSLELTMLQDWSLWRRLLCHLLRQKYWSLREVLPSVATYAFHEPGPWGRKYRNCHIQSGWPYIFSWRVLCLRFSWETEFCLLVIARYEAIQDSGSFRFIWYGLIVVMETLFQILTTHQDPQGGFLSVLDSMRAHYIPRKIEDRRHHRGYFRIMRDRASHFAEVLGVFSWHVWPILPLPCRWPHMMQWNTHSYQPSEDGRAIFPRSICSSYNRILYIAWAKCIYFFRKYKIIC